MFSVTVSDAQLADLLRNWFRAKAGGRWNPRDPVAHVIESNMKALGRWKRLPRGKPRPRGVRPAEFRGGARS